MVAALFTMQNLFDPALMGLASLSDVQTLSGVGTLVGSNAADNLLVLSLDSHKLLEVSRAGVIKSSLDLAAIPELSYVVAHNAIEGVTIDEKEPSIWWPNRSRMASFPMPWRVRA
jgi:uncharacterized protein YjiK